MPAMGSVLADGRAEVVPVGEAPAVHAMIAAGPQHWIGVQFTGNDAGDQP